MKNDFCLKAQKKSRSFLLVAALLVLAAQSTSQTLSVGDSIISALSGPECPVIKLWPTLPAPGDVSGQIGPERIRDTLSNKIRITDVTDPTITIIRPQQNNRGIAVIIAPGGAYSYLVVDDEGVDVAKRFNQDGITGIVLKYRCPTRSGVANYLAPLQDAQRAAAILKKRAKEWGLDSGKIGFCGFSAGGHTGAVLSANVATKVYTARDSFDIISSCPDFTMLIYPAYLSGTDSFLTSITAQTAPALFLCIGSSDSYAGGYDAYTTMLTSKSVVFESHKYTDMAHGSGILGPDWPTEAVRMLNKRYPTVSISSSRSPVLLPGAVQQSSFAEITIDNRCKASTSMVKRGNGLVKYDLLGRNARDVSAAAQTNGVRIAQRKN